MNIAFETPLGILYHGDALHMLASLLDESVDLVVTDPPYSSGGAFRGDRSNATAKKYTKNPQNLPKFVGDSRDQRGFLKWCTLWISECTRILKPGAMFYMFSDWRQIPTATDAMQMGGIVWRGIIPWDKTEAVRPQQGRPRNQCEYILWGTKGARPQDGIVLPGVIRCVVNGAEKEHITEKPLPVMQQLLKIVNRGDLVVDPFMGSAQTANACEIAGIRWVGSELDAAIIDRAVARLTKHDSQTPLLYETPAPRTQAWLLAEDEA